MWVAIETGVHGGYFYCILTKNYGSCLSHKLLLTSCTDYLPIYLGIIHMYFLFLIQMAQWRVWCIHSNIQHTTNSLSPIFIWYSYIIHFSVCVLLFIQEFLFTTSNDLNTNIYNIFGLVYFAEYLEWKHYIPQIYNTVPLYLIARFMVLHGTHLGPTGPRWAPCWPMIIAVWV